jgi:small subunit ribosomal protein S20
MPRRKSSLKRKRADKTKHLHNLKIKQDLKKALKKFQSLLSGKKLDEARAFLSKVYSKLDKAAKKGIIHRNTANRKKGRLTRKVSKAA